GTSPPPKSGSAVIPVSTTPIVTAGEPSDTAQAAGASIKRSGAWYAWNPGSFGNNCGASGGALDAAPASARPIAAAATISHASPTIPLGGTRRSGGEPTADS